eukprot:4666304-Lingulodinium_polyedra.AAC.1
MDRRLAVHSALLQNRLEHFGKWIAVLFDGFKAVLDRERETKFKFDAQWPFKEHGLFHLTSDGIEEGRSIPKDQVADTLVHRSGKSVPILDLHE